jgi:anti-sigma B factor antagonist
MPTEGRLRPELAGVPFSATIAPDTVVTVVRLAGELDMATERKVAHVLDEVLATTPEVVRLDLSDIEFCDARGLAALLAARQRIQSTQRRLELTGVPPFVERLLAVTGLQDRLNRD